MKCLRCGYCCLTSLVVVIKDPVKGIVEGNALGLNGSTRCPHLEGNTAGSYSCKIHHYPWFNDTPCGTHTQYETSDSNCRLGEYILKKAKNNG